MCLEDLCFDAQQAAEKALKALLASKGIPFPFVHDLNALVDLLARSGAPIPDAVRLAGRLNRFAVATRYPGALEPVSEIEYREALRLAAQIVDWVEGQL